MHDGGVDQCRFAGIIIVADLDVILIPDDRSMKRYKRYGYYCSSSVSVLREFALYKGYLTPLVYVIRITILLEELVFSVVFSCISEKILRVLFNRMTLDYVMICLRLIVV
jgi:hypothetical protein